MTTMGATSLTPGLGMGSNDGGTTHRCLSRLTTPSLGFFRGSSSVYYLLFAGLAYHVAISRGHGTGRPHRPAVDRGPGSSTLAASDMPIWRTGRNTLFVSQLSFPQYPLLNAAYSTVTGAGRACPPPCLTRAQRQLGPWNWTNAVICKSHRDGKK